MREPGRDAIKPGLADSIAAATRQPLLVLRADFTVEFANPAFCEWLRTVPPETENRPVWHIGGRPWPMDDSRRSLERALKTGEGVEGLRIERDFERIGHRTVLVNARRLGDGSGDTDRTLLELTDVTEQEQLRFELEAQKEFAEKTIDAVRDPLLVLDSDLRVKFGNERFYTTFQVSPEETVGRMIYELGNNQWDIPRLRELLERILPASNTFDNFDVEHDFEQIGRKVMVLNARRIDHHDWILLAIEDVTAARLSERQQKVLMGELQHRAKNILMNVRALAQQTRRGAHSLDDFFEAFEGRVDALARTQSLLVRSTADVVELRDLIRSELQALGAVEGRSLILHGPKLELPSLVAQPMAMTVHELATNAAKYGALSVESGVIEFRWSTEATAHKHVVRMNWRERGVGAVNNHPVRGFGMELIEQSLPYLFGGFSRLLFHSDGVECQIEFTVTKE